MHDCLCYVRLGLNLYIFWFFSWFFIFVLSVLAKWLAGNSIYEITYFIVTCCVTACCEKLGVKYVWNLLDNSFTLREICSESATKITQWRHPSMCYWSFVYFVCRGGAVGRGIGLAVLSLQIQSTAVLLSCRNTRHVVHTCASGYQAV